MRSKQTSGLFRAQYSKICRSNLGGSLGRLVVYEKKDCKDFRTVVDHIPGRAKGFPSKRCGETRERVNPVNSELASHTWTGLHWTAATLPRSDILRSSQREQTPRFLMSHPTASSSSSFQTIINNALKAYEKTHKEGSACPPTRLSASGLRLSRRHSCCPSGA